MLRGSLDVLMGGGILLLATGVLCFIADQISSRL